jgi:hypothetical protein
MRNPKAAREIVDILGGIEAVCRLTHGNPKNVYYWTGRRRAFPSRTYCKMQEALKQRGVRAPPHLWNMIGYEDDE